MSAGTRIELRRVVERWQQLPLDHALAQLPMVHELVQRLADAAADARAVPRARVPDLGPAVVMDQLTVLVYDACAVSTTAGGAAEVDVLAQLTSLRRSLG